MDVEYRYILKSIIKHSPHHKDKAHFGLYWNAMVCNGLKWTTDEAIFSCTVRNQRVFLNHSGLACISYCSPNHFPGEIPLGGISLRNHPMPDWHRHCEACFYMVCCNFLVYAKLPFPNPAPAHPWSRNEGVSKVKIQDDLQIKFRNWFLPHPIQVYCFGLCYAIPLLEERDLMTCKRNLRVQTTVFRCNVRPGCTNFHWVRLGVDIKTKFYSDR